MAGLKKVGTTGSVNGVEITANNTKEVLDALDNAVDKALTIIGIKAERYAKARCPVGTPESTGWTDKKGKRHPNKGYRGGTLRNSITFSVEDQILSIGTNVEYGPYVELGTGPYFEAPPSWEQFDVPAGKGVGHGYVRPRPYLKPAIIDHIKEYEDVITNELKNA